MRRSDLVAIAAISLIALIVLAPALAEMTREKREAICQANLQALVQASNAYAADFDGTYPAGHIRQKPTWIWWYDFIAPYVDSKSNFYCPVKSPGLFRDAEQDPLKPDAWNEKELAYGMNWRFSPYHNKDKYVRPSDVDNPARLIVYGDASYRLMRATKTCWADDASSRHDGKANFVFLDGHVTLAPPQPNKFVSADSTGILASEHWLPNQ